MKKILLALLLTSASLTHAECTFETYVGQDFLDIQAKLGKYWNFPSFNKLCEKLKKHNLGVGISHTSYISSEETIASSTIRLYPHDIYKKYNLVVMMPHVVTSLTTHPERSTPIEQAAINHDGNNALEKLANSDEDFWNKNLQVINQLRKNMK